MDLSLLRVDLDEFAEALSREEYLTQAGLKAESHAAAIRERFPALGSQAAFEEVRDRAHAAPAAEEARRLRYLAEFLGLACVDYRVRGLADRLANAEAMQVVALDGDRIPFRSVDARLKNEAVRDRRTALERGRTGALAAHNDLRREMLEMSHDEARRLGFADYIALCRELSGVDPAGLLELVRPLLARTQEMYRETLAWYLKRWVGTGIGEAARHDLVRLFRAAEFDRLFPPDAMREAAEAPLRRMGIDPKAEGRIRVDAEPRPNKVPRAFVAALRIPQEIVMVLRPGGGPDDYAAYLHELGHALHFAYTDPGLPVECRRLGDASVSEAFAFLLDGQLRERTWLKRFLGSGQPRDILRYTAFHKLWLLRRYAAKLEYELGLHAEGPSRRMAERYRDLMFEATFAEWPAEQFLSDVDAFFYSARYLRAWVFEAQLRTLLRDRFDEEWFRNDHAGPFLRGLWREGQRLPLEDLAESLGLGAPTLDPLIVQIAEDLG
jgi:hypothetical protein